MLPWIQVYSNLPEHPKIYALVDRLGLRRNYEAVGIVVSLWLWAAKNAPDGDLSGFPERAIAAAVGAGGKKKKELCKALADTGWLDVDENGAYFIHNWSRYAARLMEIMCRKREQTKVRSQRYREKHLITKEKLNLESETSRVTHALTGQDRTEHNRKESVCPPSPSSSSWSKKSLFELCQPVFTPSETALEELLELSAGMEEAVLRRALDIAQDSGKPMWGYVRGILKNWHSDGIRTVEQVDLREKRRQQGRKKGTGAEDSAQQELAAAVAESQRRMREHLGKGNKEERRKNNEE